MDDIMSIYNGSIIAISLLIFLLGAVAVKSARSGGARLFIIIAACLSYVALFVGPLQLLSYAKPTSLEWVNRNVEEAEVLHAELREGDGIYLLLEWYGTPRYYKIPWDAELAQELIEAMEEARSEAGGGQRPGSMPPSESREGEGEGEQGILDRLLGPQGEEQGNDVEAEGEGDQGEGEGEGDQGEGQGQGQSRMGMQSMAAPQRMGDVGNGELQNAGNGRVMMRNPFKQGEGEGQQLGEALDGDLTEGEGPGAQYNDFESPAMFYARPQPRYAEKEIPAESSGFMRSFDEQLEEE